MLSQSVNRVSLAAANAVLEQQRGMATLKDISIRLKSVKNIQKITKSMKMVAAAKYAKAERELKGARAYGVGAQTFYDNIGSGEESATDGTVATPKEGGKKRLLVLMTSDRGLCGAVHSSIAKEAKLILKNKPADVEYKVVCIGDKSKVAMSRVYPKDLLFTANDIGRQPPTFEDASIAANEILNSGYEFDEGQIIFNKFKTVVSYQTSKLPLMSLEHIKSNDKLLLYDSVDDDLLQSYTEYSLAQLIYYAMKESATSEQSSRMTAMDGASKNAGEMIDKLTLQFNRTRQAVITRELIEIISGAACV
jgi:F-type H+-transporting ATPase subunit gamma|uniref:ATP synthase subunit gamma n=1 Tax=Panagrolaimus sp. PS1159 TaxID=55785 RepID=A0AC35GXZ3_9BILA